MTDSIFTYLWKRKINPKTKTLSKFQIFRSRNQIACATDELVSDFDICLFVQQIAVRQVAGYCSVCASVRKRETKRFMITVHMPSVFVFVALWG